MDADDWLTQRFEEQRPHLRAVAYRMLGSLSEADDAVQESWLRLNRSDAAGVENLGGWLTTVVGRVCLNVLRSRAVRREESLDPEMHEPMMNRDGGSNAEQDALLADSVGMALLVVLDTLAPAERVAFVLHDLFDLPFSEIAPIVGRSPAAARQLASRARRRMRGVAPPDAELARQRELADAFLAAARRGDFEALLAVLDPDVVLHADPGARPAGAPTELQGAAAVARGALVSSGRARLSAVALVNGAPGIMFAPRGRLAVVLEFTVRGDRIVEIDVIAEPARLRELDVVVLDP